MAAYVNRNWLLQPRFLFDKYMAYLKTEAVVRGCSVKKLFLEISQNSQEDTCARVSFLINLQDASLKIRNKLKNQQEIC